MKRLTGLFFACIVLTMLVLPVGAQGDSQFTHTDCWFNNISAYKIDCGYMTVPEDHSNPHGATIQLAVAIIHSDNANKAPDPVLYLAGGPGGAWVHIAPIMPQRWGLSALLNNRDVILVDQRGQGLSIPNLNCIPYRDPMEAFDPDFMTGVQIERMKACLPEFEAQGINWRAFTTEQNAADLAMIPSALGYEQYNIYGSSYGTLLGLIMLRDYPVAIRSAVLDSILPPNAPDTTSQAENFETSFSLLEKYCADDITCALAYPNLRERFIETYERLKNEPAKFKVGDVEIPISAHFFAEFVYLQSRGTSTLKQIPAIITGFAENDFDVILPFVKPILTTALSEFPNQALYMTMVCPHSEPFMGTNALPDVLARYHEAFRSAGLTPENQVLCGAWEAIPTPNRDLPVSDILTLFLAGESDSLTPPYLAYYASENMTNAHVLVAPYTGHLVAENACGQQLLSSFVNEPSQALDTSCLAEIGAPGFILHTTVTRPPIQIALVILALIALFGLGQTLFAGVKGLHRIAWWASFRKLGYMPLIAAVVLYFLIAIDASVLPPELVNLGVLQALMPILIALQVAAIFSAGDEPSLEILLAMPRAISWLVLERLLVVFIVYGFIAAAGVALSLWIELEPSQDFVMLAFSWIAPALFLSGLGMFITIRTRMIVLGVMAMGFLWFIFALFREFFLPGQSFAAPLHLIQPFMWPIHVHATLDDLTILDYWINRLFMSATGIALMMSAVYGLRDTEQVLLNSSSRRRRQKKAAPVVQTSNSLKPHLSLQPVKVRVQKLAQILAIAKYEFLMRWRSRGVKVLILAPIASFVLMTMVMSNDTSGILPNAAKEAVMTSAQILLVRAELLAFTFSTMLFVPVIYIYPLLAADAIPSDEQIRVDEVLGGLPVRDAVYMSGKVLGNILAGIAAQIVAITAICIIYRFWIGVYSIVPFLDVVAGMAIVLCLMTAFAVLLGASQRTSRPAAALVLTLMILPEFFQSIDFVRWLLPSRVEFMLIYIWQSMRALAIFPPAEHQLIVSSNDYAELILFTCVQLIVVAAIVTIWRRYRSES